MTVKTKSLFTSTVFYGALLSVYCSVVPSIKLCSVRKCTAADYIDFSGIIASTLMVLVGRHNADAVIYTPDWMPGRNKKDILKSFGEEKEEEEE